MKHTLATALLATAMLAGHGTGQADTTLRLGGDAEASRTVIQVRGQMARLVHSDQPGYVLFDSGRNIAIYVDPALKEYREINQQQLDRYAEVITRLRRQLEQVSSQLQNLPELQRAYMEQQLGIPAGGLPDLEEMTTESHGRARVAGIDCEIQVLLQDRAPIGEVCLATAADAGISTQDFATLMAMMNFMRDLASTTQKMVGDLGKNSRLLLSGLQGVPVAIKDYRENTEYHVTEVSDKALDAGVFEQYRGYQKRELLLNLPKS